MRGKIPDEEAFRLYMELRSYRAVALKFQVTKRAIVKHARKWNWQQRIAEIQAQARADIVRDAAETPEDVDGRHLRILKAIESRALESLRALPIRTTFDAIRALVLSIRQERDLLGFDKARADDPQPAITEDLLKNTEGLSTWEIEFVSRGRSVEKIEENLAVLDWFRDRYLGKHPGMTAADFGRTSLVNELFTEFETECVSRWGPQWFVREHRPAV